MSREDSEKGPCPKGAMFVGGISIFLMIAGSFTLMVLGESPSISDEDASDRDALKPTRDVALDPGKRLLNAGIACNPNRECDVWTLTRDLRPGEVPSDYALSYPDGTIRFREVSMESGG